MTDQPRATEEQTQEALQQAAAQIDESKLPDVIQKKAQVDEKMANLPGNMVKVINQVALLFEMINDYWNKKYREIPWTSIALAAAAIIYIASPIDIIPDFVPVAGYFDDVLIIALAVTAIQQDLRTYCQFKGYDLDKYFGA